MKTSNKTIKNTLSHILFPLIIIINTGTLILATTAGWELGSAFTNLLIANLVALFILEKAWEFKKEWSMDFKDFARDMGYFTLNGALDTLVKVGIGYIVITYSSPVKVMPLWASAPIAILIVEFFGYWYHRLGHQDHFLWKIHSIHHVPDKVNLLNNNTANFLNIVFGTSVKLLPLIILGFNQEAVFIATGLTTIHSYVVHINADIKGGWLNYIFMSPEHHRLHHSTVIQEAKNFATLLTFWDAVFGTFKYKEGLVPKEVGVIHPENYPKPFEVIKGFVFPFTSKRLW